MEKLLSAKPSYSPWGMFVARILIVGIFAMSLIGKLTDFAGNAAYAASAGLGIPGEFLIVGAIILELIGVVTLLLGWKMKWGAYALMLFTVFATLLYHLPTDQLQTILFFKNLAIIGGLLLLTMNKPGKLSIDG